MMKKITYTPIGIIRSPFRVPKGTPIQPPAAKGVKGTVELFEKYTAGLEDLDGFSYIILLYDFHLVKEPKLRVRPFMDKRTHGVFSTRAPNRPNPIGISVVRLIRVEKNLLQVEDLDIVDGTPLLDIKPYVPRFDDREATEIGWLQQNINRLSSQKDDGRFT
jgi:tRNA (adenine37-N6)-methyltransferase